MVVTNDTTAQSGRLCLVDATWLRGEAEELAMGANFAISVPLLSPSAVLGQPKRYVNAMPSIAAGIASRHSR